MNETRLGGQGAGVQETIRPVVVPLDGSKIAEKALPAALVLARCYDAPLSLVHVVDHDEAPAPADLDRARRIFADYVEGLLKHADAEGYPHATIVAAGGAASTILDVSSNARAIVLASHGKGGLRAALIGSVADKVIRGARVPVLMVPMGGRTKLDAAPVVVGLDGSPAGESGLEVARDLAARLKTHLVLVRAFNLPPQSGIEFVAYQVDVIAAVEEGARDYLERAARPGEQCVCAMGSPVDVLVQTAAEVDAGLVVLTSHGKGWAQRLALGSTTDRAVHRIKRPLLIVPVPGGTQ